MRVLTPVGTFPLHLAGVRVSDNRPVIDTAMGAWRSEIRFDRDDVLLVAAVLGVLAAAFAVGRASKRRG